MTVQKFIEELQASANEAGRETSDIELTILGEGDTVYILDRVKTQINRHSVNMSVQLQPE